MDHQEFNRKLSSFIKEAKKLEKIDPDRARTMWLKIAEFTLEFSKSPDIDRDFRLRLWKQINVIIEKFKDKTPSPHIKETSNYEEDLDVSDFPSVPKNIDDVDLTSTTDEFKSNVGSPNNKKSDNVKEKSFFDRIQNMKEELKKLPDYFKEISPKPYNPNDTIIPKQSKSNNQNEKADINIKPGSSILGDNAPKLDSDNIDPYKGTKDMDPDSIKDPFVEVEDDEINKDKKIVSDTFCYACGAKIKTGQKICHVCGVKL